MIEPGDGVRVNPFDAPDQTVDGTVLYIGRDYCSIAVAFDAPPPFATFSGEGFSIIADGRTVLLATSDGAVNLATGEIVSPWFELFSSRQFVITAV